MVLCSSTELSSQLLWELRSAESHLMIQPQTCAHRACYVSPGRHAFPTAAFASFAFRGSAASAAAILATIALSPTQVDSKLRKRPNSRTQDQKDAAVPARIAESEGKNRKSWHHRAMAAPVGLALVALVGFVVISPVLQGQF